MIEAKYEKKAVIYDNMKMYFISTSKEIVLYCKKKNIELFSLEAFKITGEGIQPSLENSIDLDKNSSISVWQQAINFLENIEDKTYLYEIWYEGY